MENSSPFPSFSAPHPSPSAPPPAPGTAPQNPPPPPAGDAAAAPAARRGRSFFGRLWHGCLVSSFCIVVFALVCVFAAARGCSRAVTAGVESLSAFDAVGGGNEFDLDEVRELNLSEEGKEPGKNAPCVLFVPLVGEIDSAGAPLRPWEDDSGSAPAALRAIRRASLDDRIRGILLRVDSPGGEITASDDLWKALEDFRASRPGKVAAPRFVVALMGSMAASGGYYAIAGADWIVAHPTTLTGSIGVKMTSFNVRRLAERLGVGEVTIASGPNKNMLSPFEDLTEGQRAMLQAQIDALQARFVSIVAKGRGLSEARVRELADGRVFLGPEAKEAGLVDEVGYGSDAAARVSERLGGEVPLYVSYRRGGSFLSSLLTPDFLGAALRKAFPEAAAPKPAPKAGL